MQLRCSSIILIFLRINNLCYGLSRQKSFRLNSEISDRMFQRTQVVINPSTWKVSHINPLFFLGSCFSENMSAKLKALKFQVESNPFGTIYNPLSISQSLSRITREKYLVAEDLTEDNVEHGIFHSWDHHSSYSGHDAIKVLNRINDNILSAKNSLQSCNALYLTLGTTQIHTLKQNNQVVANCHKQPSNLFEKSKLSLQECTAALSDAVTLCRSFNPNLNIVLTVSPVRHTKEGCVENALSKSTLLCAAHEVTANFPFVSYFPAYEIMMDDLRDYRWYAEDMIHPSIQAQDYIFDRFRTCFFDPPTNSLCDKIASTQKDLQHKPIVKSTAYRRHLERCLVNLVKMQEINHFLDFSAEILERVKLRIRKNRSPYIIVAVGKKVQNLQFSDALSAMDSSIGEEFWDSFFGVAVSSRVGSIRDCAVIPVFPLYRCSNVTLEVFRPDSFSVISFCFRILIIIAIKPFLIVNKCTKVDTTAHVFDRISLSNALFSPGFINLIFAPIYRSIIGFYFSSISLRVLLPPPHYFQIIHKFSATSGVEIPILGLDDKNIYSNKPTQDKQTIAMKQFLQINNSIMMLTT
eukprot:gene2118-4139_t